MKGIKKWDKNKVVENKKIVAEQKVYLKEGL